MAGLFPGLCNVQQVDQNGKPIVGATLTVYNGGTLILASCYQDIGLAIPAQNPMATDQTGRLPNFYVADGVYKVTLVDPYGVSIFSLPQIASIGASASGGGGSAVDPTTVFQTGDVLWAEVQGVRSGWVRDNGRTIGSATSGATERANADCQNLFLFGWALGWAVVGGAGISAAADWAANKQITLPDKRGYAPGGLDDMGNAAAGRYAGVPFSSGNATTAGSLCGEATHVLSAAETAAHQHNVYLKDPGHSHTGGFQYYSQGTAGGVGGIGTNTNTGSAQTGITIGSVNGVANDNLTAPSGGGGAHNNVQRTVLGTFYRKL